MMYMLFMYLKLWPGPATRHVSILIIAETLQPSVCQYPGDHQTIDCHHGFPHQNHFSHIIKTEL